MCNDYIGKNKLVFFQINKQNEHKTAGVDFEHPGIKLEHKEEISRILSQVNELPSKQKTVIILKAIDGLPQKEIAEILKVSEKAVESLIYRAREKLRTTLK